MLIRFELSGPGVQYITDNQLYNSIITGLAIAMVFFMVMTTLIGGIMIYKSPEGKKSINENKILIMSGVGGLTLPILIAAGSTYLVSIIPLLEAIVRHYEMEYFDETDYLTAIAAQLINSILSDYVNMVATGNYAQLHEWHHVLSDMNVHLDSLFRNVNRYISHMERMREPLVIIQRAENQAIELLSVIQSLRGLRLELILELGLEGLDGWEFDEDAWR